MNMMTLTYPLVLASSILTALGQAQSTQMVSLDSAGVQGNAGSGSPSISPDGRFVAFESSASNLVAVATNCKVTST